MKQLTSLAIVLRRTNYGEADRIVTFLTPAGKVRAMVKGVRRSKSKLAGGIELFSESSITFLETRGNLSRIVSTRLEIHWGDIVGDLQRMIFGYEAMKLIDLAIEDEAERSYYDILKSTLTSLADLQTPLAATEVWFYLRFFKVLGYEINLKTDTTGKALNSENLYNFSFDNMSFELHSAGQFRADHIKLLRLCQAHQPTFMKQVQNLEALCIPLKVMLANAKTVLIN